MKSSTRSCCRIQRLEDMTEDLFDIPGYTMEYSLLFGYVIKPAWRVFEPLGSTVAHCLRDGFGGV